MQRDWTSSSSESSLHHQPLLGFRVLGFRRAGLRAGAGQVRLFREKKSVDEGFVVDLFIRLPGDRLALQVRLPSLLILV